MKLTLVLGICVLSATLGCALAVAQEYGAQSEGAPSGSPAAREYPTDASPVLLEWVPPALAQLSALAAVKENFTLDRTLARRGCRHRA